MLREYPNNVTFHDRGFIEQLGGYFLDSVAMGHELRLPRDAWRTFYLCELIHRGVADLTLHRFVVVHHRKCESQPLVVVSSYSATSQRHPKSPFQDNQRRMRRPTSRQRTSRDVSNVSRTGIGRAGAEALDRDDGSWWLPNFGEAATPP